ncbi:hypothetical protein Asi03nite_45020 [Actinoplanes siamensis]|uniref:Uncharacterized protein n=1 Tax=Actinoplanes siamensis TaxID=1223317 RepID=A0A919N9E3_9ACTN|nr:hypothetical protein Asi03nite_45020 [Actinoplanes siamensis]
MGLTLTGRDVTRRDAVSRADALEVVQPDQLAGTAAGAAQQLTAGDHAGGEAFAGQHRDG